MSTGVPPAYKRELKGLLEQYRAALEKDPQNPQVLVDMATVLLKLERTDDAVRCLRMAAWVYFNREEYEEAISTCGRVFRFRPVDSEAKQLVDEVRKGRLMDDGGIEAALRRGRSRQVSDHQPVVVLPARVEARDDVTVPQAEWNETVERLLPPEAEDPTDETPNPDLPSLRARVLAPREPSDHDTEPVPPPMSQTPTLADEEHDDLEPRDPDESPTTPVGQLGASRPDRPGAIPQLLWEGGASRRVPRGAVLLAEGDRFDGLLVVASGRVELSKRGTDLEVLAAGDFVGELALLGDGKAHVTYRAVDPCEVRLFEGDLLGQIMADPAASQALRRSYRDRLQQMALRVSPLLTRLPEDDARELLRRSRPLRVRDGHDVVLQGAPSSGLYLVLLGRLEVLSQDPPGTGAPRLLERLTDGDCFGELAVLNETAEPATVTARGFCQLVLIAPAELFRLVGTRPDLADLLRGMAEARRGRWATRPSGSA